MSSITVFKIFPVPVFEFQIPEHKKTNLALEKYIYNLKNEDPEGLKISNAGGWHSKNFEIEKSLPVKNFLSKIKNILPDIFENHMGWGCSLENINISAMWSVINEKNSFNIRHNHPNCYFSAAYYVKTNSNAGRIKFFDPKEVKTMFYPKIKQHNEFSSNIVHIQPEEGKLLLFPSYLHHSVEENLSDEDRIVISFNINII
jgi:uncharacterized protein (TIGR02466 family)